MFRYGLVKFCRRWFPWRNTCCPTAVPPAGFPSRCRCPRSSTGLLAERMGDLQKFDIAKPPPARDVCAGYHRDPRRLGRLRTFLDLAIAMLRNQHPILLRGLPLLRDSQLLANGWKIWRMRRNFRRAKGKQLKGTGPMNNRCALHLRRTLKASKCVMVAGVACVMFAGVARAHGGGLDADGCHTNRKTGEYHCHRSGSRAPTETVPSHSTAGVRSANSFVSTRNAPSGQTCYTGPRGGTYTITASGRKNYNGC